MGRAHVAFPDPRTFHDTAVGEQAQWYELARASLRAATARARDDADDALTHALGLALVQDAAQVDAAIEHAPTPFIARHLWRTVDRVWRARQREDALAITLFAVPLVVVTGGSGGIDAPPISAALSDVRTLVQCMRDGKALRGNETFALANVLVGASSLAIPALARWRSLCASTDQVHDIAGVFAPADIPVPHGEAAHLRFLVGSALAARGVDLLADRSVGSWGAAMTRELVRLLGSGQGSVLALPRAPQTPLVAHHDGSTAQREVSAQLFASNAIRSVRASAGEPVAVISSHRAADAPGGGELRLSISSLFAPRNAQGFRCPIYATEPVSAALSMLLDLLHDCRVADVRLVAGVHPDRTPDGMPLCFKPETIPEGALLQ